jgi:hypothetical protein
MMDGAERKVRDFLYRTPGAGVKQISEGAELDERVVLYLLNEGILTVNDGVKAGTASGPKCSICGKAINSGTICESCRRNLGKQLGSVATEQPGQRRIRPEDTTGPRPGMHIDTKRK